MNDQDNVLVLDRKFTTKLEGREGASFRLHAAGWRREEGRYLQLSEKGAQRKTTEKGSEIGGTETTEKGSKIGTRSGTAEWSRTAERRKTGESTDGGMDESMARQGGFCRRTEQRCRLKEGDLGEMMIWGED